MAVSGLMFSQNLMGNAPLAASAAKGVSSPATASPTASLFGQPSAAAPTAAARPAFTDPSLAFSGAAPAGLKPAPPPSPLQAPGNNMVNPGYGEQALNLTQNRLLEDPYSQTTQNLATQASAPSDGQNYLNQNLGTLNGPGQGDQYWNQVQGQFQDPFAGEQFTRNAAQNLSPSGPAGAFFNNAMGQYDNFTGYSGPQNGQGQYQQNAGSGPLAGQSFYDQVAGNYGTTGTYSGPNLAAGQYNQTQGAFGDMPLPDSADPYYDRAIQLGTQAYNQGAAGRGVYGSSEALSGVGNVITDLNAKRAQTAFGNQMAIEQEQRARQQLLGEQARAGDLSSLSAFGANLSGLETFGNLAGQAGQQTLGQQTMLGNQANAADQTAQAAQNSNIAGLNTYGGLASNADTAGTNRFTASTTAMNNADRNATDRLQTGANIANNVDANTRENYQANTSAATNAGNLDNSRLQTASGIANSGSANDLSRLNSFNNTAQGAEQQRQARAQSQIDAITSMSKDVANAVAQAGNSLMNASQADFENYVTTTLAPQMQAAGLSQQQQQQLIQALQTGWQIGVSKA